MHVSWNNLYALFKREMTSFVLQATLQAHTCIYRTLFQAMHPLSLLPLAASLPCLRSLWLFDVYDQNDEWQRIVALMSRAAVAS
jgi:hypothetical protein